MESPEDSALYIARRTGLAHRALTRIVLPDSTTGCFPSLSFENEVLPIVDISVGGACVRDPNDSVLNFLSQDIDLELILGDQSEPLRARVVGVSRHVNRHLQFLNLSSKNQMWLESLVRVGTFGQKLKQSKSLLLAPARLNVVELWTGVQGDGLVFYDSSEVDAEMTIGPVTIRFFHHQGPRVQVGEDFEKTREAEPSEVMEALLCLVNIDPPSERVSELIAKLNHPAPRLQKTGSDR